MQNAGKPISFKKSHEVVGNMSIIASTTGAVEAPWAAHGQVSQT